MKVDLAMYKCTRKNKNLLGNASRDAILGVRWALG